MEKNIEKIVRKQVQDILKNYINMKEFNYNEISEFEDGAEDKKDLIEILNKIFFILTNSEHREIVYLDIDDVRDSRTDSYFQVNFTIDLSEYYYMIHRIRDIDVSLGERGDECEGICDVDDNSQCIYCENYELMDYASTSLGFKMNTNIIDHEQCKLHIIGTIELGSSLRVYEFDFCFDTIATMYVEGIEDSKLIEKYYWLDYILRSITYYEKGNFMLAFFNLFAGFDAFIELINEKILNYYLDNYLILKNSEYRVFNRRDVSDVNEYLIKEIKNFGNDSRRLSDKLVSILDLIGIDKKHRKELDLVDGNNFKRREKIRNSIAHGTLTKISAEKEDLGAEWFVKEFLCFLQVIVKILNPNI